MEASDDFEADADTSIGMTLKSECNGFNLEAPTDVKCKESEFVGNHKIYRKSKKEMIEVSLEPFDKSGDKSHFQELNEQMMTENNRCIDQSVELNIVKQEIEGCSILEGNTESDIVMAVKAEGDDQDSFLDPQVCTGVKYEECADNDKMIEVTFESPNRPRNENCFERSNREMMADKDGKNSNVFKKGKVEIKQEIERSDELYSNIMEVSKESWNIIEADPDTNIGKALKAESKDDVNILKPQIYTESTPSSATNAVLDTEIGVTLKVESKDDINIFKPQIYTDFSCQDKSATAQQVATDRGIGCNTASNTSESSPKNDLEHLEIRTQSKEKPYPCSYCTAAYSRKDHLKDHMKKHTGQGLLNCHLCSFRSPYRTNLNRHLKVHTGAKVYACRYREYKSIQKRNSTSQMKNHAGATFQEFMQKLVTNGGNPYTIAFKSSPKDNSTERPDENTRDKEKTYACPYCDAKFNKRSNFKIHENKHTHKNLYNCNYCAYKSTNRTYLIVHLRTHTGEKPFACSYCDYRCIQKVSLNNHIRKHTIASSFHCDHCGFKCFRKTLLRRHMRTHYLINIYKKKYAADSTVPHNTAEEVTRRRLERLMRDRPYACPYCDSKYIRKGHLSRHLRKHTGVGVVHCQHCSYRGTDKWRLTQHMKRHSAESTVKLSAS